jgi:hypothetical protein
MNYESRTPDRTNHRREIESRRADRRGPSQKRIEAALGEIASHEIPGLPNVGTLRVLQALHESEWRTDGRLVKDFKIQQGRPDHGELRSDDHVSYYEVSFPSTCSECGHGRAIYKYSANHHISGYDRVYCPNCEHVTHSEDWG